MTMIVVLFNLKPDVSAADYEALAKTTDLPVVRGLDSIDEFVVGRATGLLGSDAPPPYGYIEVIRVNDMDLFGAEVGSETMQRVAGEFQQWADAPLFIMTQSIEETG